jgi:hypothetical protein
LSEPWKTRETRELKKKIRREYDVPLPEDDVLYGKGMTTAERGAHPDGLLLLMISLIIGGRIIPSIPLL